MNGSSIARHALAAFLTFATVSPALGGIKLITLPTRQRVEIQLDHLSATLVEEERIVPLAAGVNDVVFAWANTSIDKESIQFRCLTDPDNIKVLSVSYPPNENALTWQVASPRAASARVRISYIIAGLDKEIEGRVHIVLGYSVGMLDQEPQLRPGSTVRESVEEGVKHLTDLVAAYDATWDEWVGPDAVRLRK